MLRGTIAAMAVTGLVAFGVGCDDASENAAEDAAKTTEVAKDRVDEATKTAKDKADATMSGKADNAAKDGADAVQNAAKDLLDKANAAIKDKNWTDAENYLKQAEEKVPQLPAEHQAGVKASIDTTRKAIDAAKKVPAMP